MKKNKEFKYLNDLLLTKDLKNKNNLKERLIVLKEVLEKNSCKHNNHIYTPWEELVWTSMNGKEELYNKVNISKRYECWIRTCLKCGYQEVVTKEPTKTKTK